MASNDLDESLLTSLKYQKSKISVWGIGTKLITAYDNPSLGAVYKLSALQDENGQWVKKLKLSEQKLKINNTGIHQVRRFFRNNKFLGDMIYDINLKNNSGVMIDPNDSTKSKKFLNSNIEKEDLLKPIFKNGKLLYKSPSIHKIRDKLISDLCYIDKTHKRLENPHNYPVGLEKSLFEEKNKMILELRKK